MPIKIKPKCNSISTNLKETWVIGNISLEWPNNCEKIQLISINGKTKNIYLFEDPTIRKEYLPLNFTSLEKFHNITNGDFLGDEF